MTPERELLIAARDALEPGKPLGPQYMNTLEGRAAWLDGTRPLRAKIDALLALPATARSEPVAWRWKWKHHGDWRHTGAQPQGGDAIDVEPLYAAPQSESAASETAKVPEEAVRLLRWWLRTHGDEDGIPKPVEEATKVFLASVPSPSEKQSLLLAPTATGTGKIFDTPSPDGNYEPSEVERAIMWKERHE